MDRQPAPRQSGERPLALTFGGFELRVQGSTQHDSDDTWDATWLAATASCNAADATISCGDLVLTSWSVRRFCEGLSELARTHSGCALLAAEGPQLSVRVHGPPRAGRLALDVDIAPTGSRAGRTLTLEADERELPGLIAQCHAVLDEFPTREVE